MLADGVNLNLATSGSLDFFHAGCETVLQEPKPTFPCVSWNEDAWPPESNLLESAHAPSKPEISTTEHKVVKGTLVAKVTVSLFSVPGQGFVCPIMLVLNAGAFTKSGSVQASGAGEVGGVSRFMPGKDVYHARLVDGVIIGALLMLKFNRPVISSSTAAAARGVGWLNSVNCMVKMEQEESGMTDDTSKWRVPALLQLPCTKEDAGLSTLTLKAFVEFVCVPLSPVIVSEGKHFLSGTFEARTTWMVLLVHGY